MLDMINLSKTVGWQKKTHVFYSAFGFVGLWDGSTKMTEIFQRYLWDMWDMEKLCGTVGWLEKKTPGFFSA